MPVTLKVAIHAPRKWQRTDRAQSEEALLKGSCPEEYRKCGSIIQSSFCKLSSQTPVYSSSNGFVRAAVAAYSNHHHLIIRPEDVWFAILTQLSFFVNAHAEELRQYFVSHSGQKELEVIDSGSIDFAKFGAMAQRMTKLMDKNLNDHELLPWIMPAFSTTEDTDKVVASVIMMGAMQKYFSYKFSLRCGIPSVTLLGTQADWEEILQRLEKLPNLGTEPAQFYNLLKPVVTYFVASFESPVAASTRQFWKRIAHKSGGSGPHYLSGWITAFCFWDCDGKSLYAPRGEGPSGPVEIESFGARSPGCDLSGTMYHRVNLEDIPAAYASVPVKLDDNGRLYDTIMVAGSVGVQVTSSGDALDEDRSHARASFSTIGPNRKHIPYVYVPATATGQSGPDTLQPVSGWWMFVEAKIGDLEADQVAVLPKDEMDGSTIQNRKPKLGLGEKKDSSISESSQRPLTEDIAVAK